LVKVARQGLANPGQYADLAANSASGGVTVYRAGRPVAIALAKLLQRGDEVETATDSVAVIRYPNGGEVLIDQRTRVRLGSLDVLFGRIFARVKGVFSVESESVIAGVEGTAFAISVKPQREVSVTVLDGTVVCRSRMGTWEPLRLLQSQTLLSEWGSASGPRIAPAGAEELEQLKAWVTRVDRSLPPPRADAY
jgi:ferric-dicitrate binding protein FerR (iron transport regulator)